MKKTALLLALLFALISLYGCSGTNDPYETDLSSVTESAAPTEAAFDTALLTDADWTYYDGTIGENVRISFTKAGEYYYGCDCGEPIGNSDVFDSYTVDPVLRVIKLTGPDNESDEIGILYADESYLCLMIDGGARLFKNLDSEIDDVPHEDAEEYMPDKVSAFLTVTDYSDGVLTLAPHNYDRDAHNSFADCIYKLRADDDIEFHSVSVIVEHYDSEEDSITVNYYKMSDDEIMPEDNSQLCGYVEIGDDGQVEKVVCYGTTEIWG